MKKRAAIVNYQNRAAQFAVGDVVYPYLGSSDLNGRVVAVWPAIGMLDVEWPQGNQRVPVEEVQKLAPDAFYQPPEVDQDRDSIPGGAETIPVSVGPSDDTKIPEEEHVSRVAMAFVKKALWHNERKALYWAQKDRQYKATRSELDAGCYQCPNCPGVDLKKATYKRRDGTNIHLLGCPSCMFLIKREDIIGDPNHVEVTANTRRKRRV